MVKSGNVIDCRGCGGPRKHASDCPIRAAQVLGRMMEIGLVIGCLYFLAHIALWAIRGFPIRP